MEGIGKFLGSVDLLVLAGTGHASAFYLEKSLVWEAACGSYCHSSKESTAVGVTDSMNGGGGLLPGTREDVVEGSENRAL